MQEPLRVPPSAPARLVVLASGTGSLLRSLLDAAVGDYPARVVAVGVDRECRAAEIAAEASVPVFTVRLADHPSCDAWDVAITAATAAHEPDLVVSAGFMRILGPQFLSRFYGRTLNTHPALLPAFPGTHGVADALAYGVKVTGATNSRRSVTLIRSCKVSSSSPSSTDDGRRPIRRALISVYDKTGLVDLAQGLSAAGVEIISTGSTAKTIADTGIPVTPVEQLTGFPEVLDGRVKTLHPRVHAGLLADLRKSEHAAALEQLGIEAFELVVVNLYPFSQTVESGASVDDCVEQIDIGGPAMVRAAAKNHPSAAVVTDPLGYHGVLAALRAGGFTLAERKRLASLAFQHIAEYDIAVASWMQQTLAPEHPVAAFPQWFGRSWRRVAMLRYGENPHQQAALYGDPTAWPGLAQAEQLHGKDMSYNNFTDADAAWRAAFDHEQTCVAIIKHANPCGIAISSVSVADAHRKAHECDPLSAYGGVIAANTEVSVEMAEYVSTIFTEVIVAPGYAPGALDVLARKKNIRVLVAAEPLAGGSELRPISGGLLIQQSDQLDAHGDNPANWTLATGSPADPATLTDLVFAWRACRAVKSNAIVIAADGATVGVGMGQVNRVDAARLAVERGGERVRGAVAASDAFFPFPDGLETLAAAGVTAVVHPGGSVRDEEVTEAAAKAGVTLYLTGARHFAH